MSEFVPASRLYHVTSRTPIAHPAHQATDEQVRRALEDDRESRTDGGRSSSGTERTVGDEETAVIDPFRGWAFETADDRHVSGGSTVGYKSGLYTPLRPTTEIRSLHTATKRERGDQ